MSYVLDEVGRCSDVELVRRLERLVRADRALSAKLLVHLGEVDARKLYCARSYSSMFNYCRCALGMSESEAYLRIHAARVGRRFPLVVERLGAGAVHLSAIKMLSPHLTHENHAALLDRVRGLTKRQIEALLAELAPKPDVAARMRKLPERHTFEANAAAKPCGTTVAAAESGAMGATRGAASASTSAAASGSSASSVSGAESLPLTAAIASSSSLESGAAMLPPTAAESSSAQSLSSAAGPASLPPIAAVSESAPPNVPNAPSTFALSSPKRRSTCTPLRPGRFRLDVTLGQEAHDALEQLVELFRHQNPHGDLGLIVERALNELLVRTMKRRFGQGKTTKPRVTRELSGSRNRDVNAKGVQSRYIPLAVRRAVHARDEGRCTYVGPDGRRCSERGFIEVHHHYEAFARGGGATVENLRLACRTHNLFLAEQEFGPAFMREKLAEARMRDRKAQVLAPDPALCEVVQRDAR